MCIKCEDNVTALSYREVPIRLLMKLQVLKETIRSNNEKPIRTEYFQKDSRFYAGVTFEYFDGYGTSQDSIIISVPELL